MSDDLRERVALLPCPFCGPTRQKPILHKGKGVKCHTCGAWGPAWEKPTGEEWNTPAELEAMLAKAREEGERAGLRKAGKVCEKLRKEAEGEPYSWWPSVCKKAIEALIPTAEDT